jgi:hypothetical protein
MKRVIIGLVLAVATAQTANAFDLQSPRGISQSEWNASSEYQNFQCPANSARGEGVDMNFTTNRADDFYFVTCTPRQIPTTVEIADTITAVTVITTQPITPVEPNPVPVAPTNPKTITVETTTAVIDTITAQSDTSTATFFGGFDWVKFWVQFEIWFKSFFAKLLGIKL